MNISSPLLIHIGYAKAASTWIQTHVLGNRALGFYMPFDTRSVRIQLQVPPPFQFSADSCRRFFYPTLQTLDPVLGFPVLSCEGLTGTSRIGDYQRKVIADRLADVFPGARILLVVREQKSMLLAQYHQYLRRGGVYSLNRFLNPPMTDGRRIPYFDWNRFRYHHLLQYYQRLFGNENVLVLPLEMLGRATESFLQRLTDFCGLDFNDSLISTLPVEQHRHASQSGMVMNLRRPLNFLMGEPTSFNPRSILPLRNTRARFKRWGQSIDSRLPHSLKRRYQKRVKAIVAAAVGDYFAAGNQKLCDLTGLDLEQYGYNVAPKAAGKSDSAEASRWQSDAA